MLQSVNFYLSGSKIKLEVMLHLFFVHYIEPIYDASVGTVNIIHVTS